MATLRMRRFTLLQTKKVDAHYRAIGASIVALALSGIVMAVLAISTVLALYSDQVAVTLSPSQDIPRSITIGQEADFRIRIQTTRQVTDATLWFQVRADGMALDDPATTQVSYRHPGQESFRVITLTPTEGKLIGPLKSEWTIPADYDDSAELLITFLSDYRPTVPYFVDIWAEGT